MILSISVANETFIVGIPANATSFEFPKRVKHNEQYHIGLSATPVSQSCSINNIIGTALADVSNVIVSCLNRRIYTIQAGAGAHGTVSPSGAVSVYYQGNMDFVATPDPGYVVDRWVVQGGTVASSGNRYRYVNANENADVLVTFRPALLTANVPVLALSVSDTATDPALTGTPRNIVITNASPTTTATNLSVSLPSFPPGTTMSSSTCGSTLVPGATCSITITPGSTATSACTTGVAAAPANITVTADEETTPLSVGVVVLGYACLYQNGYVFAIDDTTPVTASIGGKVAKLIDIDGIAQWSPDDQLVGVARNSLSPCVSDADGACNSSTILSHYVGYATNDFAAGLCERLNTSLEGVAYAGWYLPAYCEASVCGAGQPSMQANLWARNNSRLLSGTYWTSTEAAGSPTTQAQAVTFASDSASTTALSKREFAHMRCVRKLN